MAIAVIICATRLLIGSSSELGQVFVWGIKPTKKALRLSGANSCEVIVKFNTLAAFEKDPGIEDPYVRSFNPKRSYFSGPITISNPVILPI